MFSCTGDFDGTRRRFRTVIRFSLPRSEWNLPRVFFGLVSSLQQQQQILLGRFRLWWVVPAGQHRLLPPTILRTVCTYPAYLWPVACGLWHVVGCSASDKPCAIKPRVREPESLNCLRASLPTKQTLWNMRLETGCAAVKRNAVNIVAEYARQTFCSFLNKTKAGNGSNEGCH